MTYTPQHDSDLLTLTADIVAAHVGNNSVAISDLSILINNVHSALAGPSKPVEVAEEKPVPAVSIRSSVKPDYILCLEDGKKLKMLRRHLMTQYRQTPKNGKRSCRERVDQDVEIAVDDETLKNKKKTRHKI